MNYEAKMKWHRDRLVAAYWCGSIRAILARGSPQGRAAKHPSNIQLSLPGIWEPAPVVKQKEQPTW